MKQPLGEVLLGKSLKAKVFRGGAWLGVGSLAEQAIRFGRNMLLARLLAPEAFGTMAIALSVGSVIHTITDMGVKEAIIQNPRGSEDRYASAAWWLALGRAFSLYALIFLLAGWISSFYGNRELVPLVRVLALGVIFDGALSSKAYIAMKEMKFAKWAGINHGGGICGVIITVILSFFIRDVWALVFGYLSESLARCLLSYILCPYLPSLSWDREAVRDLVRFSRGVVGLAFLNLVFARTDIFVLAKLYPASQLGLYVMAVYLAQTPTSFIMNLQGQTLLPTFSQIQGDNPRVNRIFLQATSLLVLLGIPALVFAFFCGRSILTIAYGQRYGAVAASFIVAAFVGLFNISNGQLTTIFFGKGLPQLHRRCVVIMAITMIVLVYPFTKRFGLVGGQLACLISILLGYLYQITRLPQLTELNLAQYGRIFLRAAGISLVAIVICLGARWFGILARPVPNILLGIVACLSSYGLGLGVFLWSGQKVFPGKSQAEMETL